MATPNLTVRHGWLDRVSGTAMSWGDVSFSAASVRLKGNSFTRSHDLAEHVKRLKLPPGVRALMLNGDDAPWVRGRIERLFYPALRLDPQERGEKSGLQADFVGVVTEADGTLVGVPFWCNDYYLQTGLMFSEAEDPPPMALCDRIADAFWGLLLAEPHDLADYTDQMYHIGAGVWLVFGISRGQPYIEERKSEPRRLRRKRR